MSEIELLSEISARLVDLINIGVWACRCLSVVAGLLIFRIISLRSPV